MNGGIGDHLEALEPAAALGQNAELCLKSEDERRATAADRAATFPMETNSMQ